MNNLHLRDGKIEFRWKRWRNKKRQEVSYCLMVLFSGAVLFGAGGMALAGPTGGQVTSGTGTISQAGTTTTVNQASNVLDINWQTFSTAPNEAVNFNQPGSTSLAINRVVGGVPSYLQGALNANGRVFILNSAGVTFAGTSRVNVGALLATTAMTIDGDANSFANFSAPSGSGGSVVNQGSITVSDGGFAILAAPYVQNTGFIKADLGTVALAGTNSFTLDLRGDGLINFVVPPGTAAEIAADGQKVGVDNSGTLQARSGQVIISANVATQVVNAVVNMSGVVDADALAANGKGGSVLVTSAGDINLGGTITAEGNGTGAGGNIVTKAGGIDTVESHAELIAGGAAPGQGGHIEISGKGVHLDGHIDPGYSGSLLIDPQNINITTVTRHSNPASSVVSENFIEAFLDSGHRTLTLTANHDITFTAVGKSHILNFNSGNLDLVAGGTQAGSILFKAKDYEIRAGAGSVNMFANGGNIGSSHDRLSIVTGEGADFGGMYSGVTQAGDIVLNAGKDIFLGNVTAKSVPGNASDKHAEFDARAGHGIDIAGAVDIEAAAAGSGGELTAAASAVLLAPHINVKGPVTVHANAEGRPTSLDRAVAILAAANAFSSSGRVSSGVHATHAQDIHFGNAINVSAITEGGALHEQASAEVLLAGETIKVDGQVTDKASATGNFAGQIRARSVLYALGDIASTVGPSSTFHRVNGADQVDFVSGINVTANVEGSYAAFITKARGSVAGDSVTFGAPVNVNALANAADASTFVRARAEWFVEGSSSSRSPGGFSVFGADKIHFANALTVTANAVDNGPGIVGAVPAELFALAEAGLWAGSFEADGPVKLTATATNKSGTAAIAGALADAHLRVGSHRSFHSNALGSSSSLGGNVDITFKNGVQLQAVTDGQLIDSSAKALEYVTLAGRDITVAGGITGIASATGHGAGSDLPHMVVGSANALLLGSDINVKGPVTIHADADGRVSSLVRAVAILAAANAFARNGGSISSLEQATHAQDIHFGDAIDVAAFANGGAPHVTASAEVLLAGDSIAVDGEATVKATATGNFAGRIGARALLLAVGNEHSSHGPGGSSSFFYKVNGAENIDFESGINVMANVQGSFAAFVTKARGSLAADSVTVDGPVVFNALANADHASTLIRARAELFVEDSVSSHSHSQAPGTAFFHVYGADKIDFGNAVTVTADAMGSSAGAVPLKLNALSELELFAGHSSGAPITGSIEVGGPVKVTAAAINKNTSDVIAGALSQAKLIVGADYSGHASAAGHSINLEGDVNIDFENGIQVQALTHGGKIESAASALESAHLAGRDITVDGDITALASATGHGTIGDFASRVLASADLFVVGELFRASFGSLTSRVRFGASSIKLDGNVNILAMAAGGDLNHSVRASDAGRILAGGSEGAALIAASLPATEKGIDVDGNIIVDGKITMLATAENSGGDVGSVFASADLIVAAAHERFLSGFGFNSTQIVLGSSDVITLKKGLDVEANVEGGNVAFVASGNARADLGGVEITVGGNAVVLANASGHGFALSSFSFDPHVGVPSAVLVANGGSTQHRHGGSHNRIVHAASSVLFQGNVDVEALAIGSDVSGISASAFASLDAAKVRIKGTKKVVHTP